MNFITVKIYKAEVNISVIPRLSDGHAGGKAKESPM